ncbi:ankyrin repeat-containing domain protein [Nemania abortiva]|nr:ankyrin repeat-containing domain protein [Nemania abortiva]
MDAELESTSMDDWEGSDHFYPNNCDLANQITDMTRGLVEVTTWNTWPSKDLGRGSSPANDSFKYTEGARVLPPSRSLKRPSAVERYAHDQYLSSESYGVVQFIHQSVKDFLVEKNYLATLEIKASERSSLLGRGHFHLARSCIRYLCCKTVVNTELEYQVEDRAINYDYQEPPTVNVDVRPCTSSVEHRLPLIQYALSEWHRHLWIAQQAGAEPQLLLGLLRHFYLDDGFSYPDSLIELCRFLSVPCLISKRSTILHIMAAYGLEKPATVSLQSAEVDLNAEDSNRKTAIEVAIQYRRIEVVKVLIDYHAMDGNHNPHVNVGASQNLVILTRHGRDEAIIPPQRRVSRMPLLGYIASNGTRQIMELVISHLDKEINQSSNLQDNTPLMLAILWGNNDIVDFLLTLNALDVNAQDLCGRTALAIAIRGYKYPAVKMLLQHPRIDVNCQDKDKRTPLHEAVHQENIRILEMLLLHPKLDPNVGDTAKLHRLISESNHNIKRMLSNLNNGAAYA